MDRLTLSDDSSVIVKRISPPKEVKHPRGWGGGLSHARKLKSYEVERYWYQHWSVQCDDRCRVPRCYEVGNHFFGEGRPSDLLVLEDLDAQGFYLRLAEADASAVLPCVQWLAHFHARFLGASPVGLWGKGTYWHLETRPDEWAAMPEGLLKDAAQAIDSTLHNAKYKTLVHGDAKLANFCVSESGTVAAVDFQYVGAGVGVQDLIYLIGSMSKGFPEEAVVEQLIDAYFDALKSAMGAYHPHICSGEAADDIEIVDEIVKEWRQLLPLAWADFERFLAGWMPTHHKRTDFSRRQTQLALEKIK
nr:phosphotransferase [Marinibactrum halimedae]